MPYYQGPVIFAPVYLPAEVLYGPEPVWRLMGVAHWVGPPGRVKVEAQRPEEAAAEGDQDRPAAQRASNPETLALAGRFVALGDQMFHKRKYVEANGRYRTAAQIAPGLADAHFRQGFALVAIGRYEAAAKAFKRGLEIEPDWAVSDFRLESLYGANEADKAAHFERLAEAAARQAPNADLLFVIGVCLHFDGQAQRALAFFRRAAQLAGANRTHLKGFLKGPGPDPAEK
ncbi:MAG: tetratricopeptide repeat protein [Thermoguttaceae bacterium]